MNKECSNAHGVWRISSIFPGYFYYRKVQVLLLPTSYLSWQIWRQTFANTRSHQYNVIQFNGSRIRHRLPYLNDTYFYYYLKKKKKRFSSLSLCSLALWFSFSQRLLTKFAFKYFGFERIWWKLFQRHAVCTKLDIYVVIIPIRVSEWVSDCCLAPVQQFFSYVMARTS